MTTATTSRPPLTCARLTVFACGGVQAALLPNWLAWLREHYPATEVRCALTNSALRFTTPLACSMFNGGSAPFIDTWQQEIDHAVHVEQAAWPDGIIVHPATMNTVARLALGIADTPMLLALQCTEKPVVVCPALPPGGHANPAYRRHIAELSERPNFAVLPPIRGVSLSTGEAQIGTAAMFAHAVEALEDLRSGLGA